AWAGVRKLVWRSAQAPSRRRANPAHARGENGGIIDPAMVARQKGDTNPDAFFRFLGSPPHETFESELARSPGLGHGARVYGAAAAIASTTKACFFDGEALPGAPPSAGEELWSGQRRAEPAS